MSKFQTFPSRFTFENVSDIDGNSFNDTNNVKYKESEKNITILVYKLMCGLDIELALEKYALVCNNQFLLDTLIGIKEEGLFSFCIVYFSFF